MIDKTKTDEVIARQQTFYDELCSEPDFRYTKAREAWKAWEAFYITPERIESLLHTDYQTFCTADETADVRTHLFRLVAYCDRQAKDKGKWNEYPDKRTIAYLNIRPNDWIKLLMQYKRNGERATEAFDNLIRYIEDPLHNFPIMSEDHKRYIVTYFAGKPYHRDTFYADMRAALSHCPTCANPQNDTTLLAHLIYSFINEWNKPPIRGLLVHQTGNEWKERLLEKMGDGYACIWWDKLPRQYGKEIMSELQKLADNRESFDFYTLVDNKACHRATVTDFATRDNYAGRAEEWKALHPCDFEENIADYDDGQKHATLVFLISKFERLASPIPKEQFVLYRNMTYNTRGGIAAFTHILTPKGSAMKTETDHYTTLLQTSKNLILQGAPGTGKTFRTPAIAVALADGGLPPSGERAELMDRYNTLRTEGRITFVTFHQSMDYEDFVEGLRPEVTNGTLTYDLKSGPFKLICEAAEKDPGHNYVLIIDEINRGNVSRIFGELITLIEKDKRLNETDGLTLPLTYSKKDFSVPNNLYIIGTMNTTDRSTGTLDYALRRRFVFVTLKADRDLVAAQKSPVAQTAAGLFDDVRDFIESHRIDDTDIDDLMVGHSYFMARDEDELRIRMTYGVVPLVKEYIHDGLLRRPVPPADGADYFTPWTQLKKC